MRTGTIVSWCEHDGFIRPDDGGALVTLSASALTQVDRHGVEVGARIRYVAATLRTHVVACNARIVARPYHLAKVRQVAEIK